LAIISPRSPAGSTADGSFGARPRSRADGVLRGKVLSLGIMRCIVHAQQSIRTGAPCGIPPVQYLLYP
jgi:hypothetical protein